MYLRETLYGLPIVVGNLYADTLLGSIVMVVILIVQVNGCYPPSCALTVIAAERGKMSRERTAKYWYESKHHNSLASMTANGTKGNRCDRWRESAIGRQPHVTSDLCGPIIIYLKYGSRNSLWHLLHFWCHPSRTPLVIAFYHVAILDRNAQNSAFELIGPCRMEPCLG